MSIRFVVVGFGNIGKRHCEEIVRHPDAKLVAICDVDETKERQAWKDYPVPFFNSLDAFMLSSFEADVISICTPNGFHAPLSLQALNFYSHVVCEKPMALKPQDCQAMIDLAKEVDKGEDPEAVEEEEVETSDSLIKGHPLLSSLIAPSCIDARINLLSSVPI
jgi:predicted dehydrogenase